MPASLYLRAALIAALTTLPLAAPTASAQQKAKPETQKKAKPAAQKKKEAPPPPAVSGEIELVHQLGKDKGEQLKQLVERFNAANPNAKIIVSDRDWKKDGLPLMLILDEADESAFLAGQPRYRPLHQVMREAGEKLETLKPPAQMTPVPVDASGKLIGLPVGLSTPIMFYNKDAFKKAGLNPDQPPRTWWDLQQALGQLYDAGIRCPYTSSWPSWVHVENISAWHNEPFAAGTSARPAGLAVNGLVQVKHLAMMSSWYKSRYLQIFGRAAEADARFASGECAVITTSSGSFPTFRRTAKFNVGVSTLPYHDDIRGAPQNTIADGPVLWITSGYKPEQYKVAARFVSFLLTPEMQVEWQYHMGYLPLNRAGLLAASSEVLKEDLVNNRIAIQQLTHKPVTEASRGTRIAERGEIRTVLEEELESVWANKKPAKEALDTAVGRARIACPRC